MDGQKLENILNMALDVTNQEREKSLELEVGYHPVNKEWDLIVKYSGNLKKVKELDATVVELKNGFAIITIREFLIPALLDITEIEYIEKPKRLFFQSWNGKRVSCISSVQNTRPFLFGKDVIIAVIDSGIAYDHMDFRNEDGTTRILNLWDQSIEGRPPEGYFIGSEYTKEDIDRALEEEEEMLEEVPSVDFSGHGTAVAGIASGNGNGSKGKKFAGVAPLSSLIVVKLGNPKRDGFPRTTELMQALNYVVDKAREYKMPVAVNISFGNTYGAHDGTSLLERYIDALSNYWKSVICIGSGNEGSSSGHTQGKLKEGIDEVIPLSIQEMERTVNVQIWKAYHDIAEITLISPGGVKIGPIQEITGVQRFQVGETQILLYYGEPSPYSINQEIYIDLLPKNDYITEGIWKIILTPKKIITGDYFLWLPSEKVLNKGTEFLFPSEEITITIPATAKRAISVGAYDPFTFTYADFSGRGSLLRNQKPDVIAPGVNIMAPSKDGTYASVTGTSFAAPFVTGGAALMMEWGIVRGNDPYLYGEKIRAYMQRGAGTLRAFSKYPNNQTGYGTLCIKDSIIFG